MRWLALLCCGCLVRTDLYEQRRVLLEEQDPVWADCDGDGWGDPNTGAVLPEAPPDCENGTWVAAPNDCDDSDPVTGRRSGALCADDFTEAWRLLQVEDRELLVILSPRDTEGWTHQQALDRCGPLGWGGQLADVQVDIADQVVGALPDFVGAWTGAAYSEQRWSWSDSQDIELSFCLGMPTSTGLVLIANQESICLGGPGDLEADSVARAPGFICQRPSAP